MNARYICLLCLLVGLTELPLWAATASTPAQLVARAVAVAVEDYLHAGNELKNVSFANLADHTNPEVIEQIAGGPLSSRVILLEETIAAVTSKGRVIAVTSDVIVEDRRETPGRYVVWINGQEIGYAWEPLKTIDQLLKASGITMSTTRVWRQPGTLALGGEGIPPANLQGQPIPEQTPQDLAPPSGVESSPSLKSHVTKKIGETQGYVSPPKPSSYWLLALGLVFVVSIGLWWRVLNRRP